MLGLEGQHNVGPEADAARREARATSRQPEAVGKPHHLTQRGNKRQPTFFGNAEAR